MLSSQRAIVNQRLYYCRLHLDWMAQQLSQQRLPRHVVEQSLGESLCFHLVMTYRAYVTEIAHACLIIDSTPTSAEQLLVMLDNKGVSCGAAQELAALESSDSWLLLLLQCFDDCENGAVSVRPAAFSANTATDITIKQLDEQRRAITLDSGRQVLEALNDLIENQRSLLEEW